MNKNVNLTALRDEIDNRKGQRNNVSTRLGESVGSINTMAPRDAFLNGLLESLQTGRETESSILLRKVDGQAPEVKSNAKLPVNNRPVQQSQQQSNRVNDAADMSSPERDEQLYADLENKRKQTLTESIGSYINTPKMGAPMQNNYQPQQQNTSMQINEAYLSENVKGIVNNYLSENFGPIVEEAIKSTILEMYAVERIKEVLQENKDLIKTVVVEVFREIKAKNDAKAQR